MIAILIAAAAVQPDAGAFRIFTERSMHADCYSWERINREGICEPIPGAFEHSGPAQDFLFACRREHKTCTDTDRPDFNKPVQYTRWICDGPRFDSSCRPGKGVVCHAPFGEHGLEGPDPRPTLYADFGRIAYCP